MTSPAPRRAVLFDMDDTLLLTREVKWDHHRFVAREHYGIELDDQTLRAHWGEPFDEMIGNLYRHSAPVDEMRAVNKACAHRYPKAVVPGAVEVVTSLMDAGLLVGVVTSTNTDMALADLDRCGLPVDRLCLVHGADVTGHHKPDPRVFDRALEFLRGLNVTEVTYVGDAVMDDQAAAGAELGFIAVTTGLFDASRFEGRAVVDDITDVLPLLLGDRA